MSRIAALGVVTLAACALLLFKDLGLENLQIDEARTTTRAIEMVESGDWIVPRLDGKPDLRKPPLKLWLVAATLSIFGDTEAIVRMWDPIFGLGTLALLFWYANRLGGPIAAFTATIALVTIPEFLFDHSVRTNVHDSALWFFVSASAIVYACGPPTIRRTVGSAMLAGAALLTKGLAAFSLFAVVFALEAVTTRLRGLLRARVWIWAGIALAIALAWLVPAALLAREELASAYTFEYRRRIVGSGLASDPAYYVRFVWQHFGIWLVLAIPSIASIIRRPSPETWLPVVWAIVGVAFFTAASMKYPWYVIPAYPAIAVLVGHGAAVVVRSLPLGRPSLRDALAVIGIAAAFAPAYLRVYGTTGEIRWTRGEFRAFADYAIEHGSKDVPVLLYHPEEKAFSQHERLSAFRLRERLRRVRTADELCGAIRDAAHGAFAIVADGELSKLACLGRYETSLPLPAPDDIPERRSYVPKRVLPIRVPSPPFFVPAEISADIAAGEGLGTGWDPSVVAAWPTARGIVGDRAMVGIDLPVIVAGELLINGEWSAPPRTECAPRVEVNGVPLGTIDGAGPEVSLPIPAASTFPGRNFFGFVRPCPEVPFPVARLAVRPRDASGVPDVPFRIHSISAGRGHRRVGSVIDDPAASSGVATAGRARPDHSEYLFLMPLDLEGGVWVARFELRAQDLRGADAAAFLEVFSKTSRSMLGAKRVPALAIATPDKYLPIEIRFTVPTKLEKVQPAVRIAGDAEIRLATVTLVPAWMADRGFEAAQSATRPARVRR